MKIYAVLYPNLEAVKKDTADKLRRAVRRFAKRAATDAKQATLIALLRAAQPPRSRK